MDGEIAALANAGLHLDQPLQLRFVRSESETWVSRDYRVDEERATDAFNAFLRVRDLHREAAFLKAGKLSHAKAAAMGGAAAGADALRRADVHRLVALLCDKPQIEEQVDLFMERFEDPESPLDTPISRDRFLEVLEEEAASLRLNWCEQLFFTCDEPTSSMFSLWLALGVMLVIIVSSVGFIFSSEPIFQVPSADGETPPVELASLQVLEAWCMIIFSVEYVARLGTVGAVREHLRPPVVDFTIIFPTPPPPEEEPSSVRQAKCRLRCFVIPVNCFFSSLVSSHFPERMRTNVLNRQPLSILHFFLVLSMRCPSATANFLKATGASGHAGEGQTGSSSRGDSRARGTSIEVRRRAHMALRHQSPQSH